MLLFERISPSPLRFGDLSLLYVALVAEKAPEAPIERLLLADLTREAEIAPSPLRVF
jgi:hypothetical protein